ncbi:YafY family protein [Myroides sp. N17-2]|uniref:helix-turn-helix transcriptional regulator n=1 Tax=Myroides sp. N17-2 TaxID=2030799 RepID=UPI000EFA60F8|nr:YafY family protein [Myroides sp. N17-2]
MSESKPRLNRLTAIVTQLQSKRIVTATEIAEKHNVSIRTVYRDIRTLEQSGIPVFTEEGKGYSLIEGYALPPVMFTQDEANALITAEQLILKNKDASLIKQYQNAILKLKAVLRYTQKDQADFLSQRIIVRDNPDKAQTSNYLMKIQSAIVNHQVLSVHYLSLENQESKREIEPFALYTTQDNWILIAYCRLRNDFRAFRLDCIQSLHDTLKVFEPHQITMEQYLTQNQH